MVKFCSSRVRMFIWIIAGIKEYRSIQGNGKPDMQEKTRESDLV